MTITEKSEIDVNAINEKLPFLLRRENVARYEDGQVVMLDRSRYPFERHFVRCRTVEEAAQAIEKMIIQGGAQWIVAAYAMVIQAREAARLDADAARASLMRAQSRLVATRPTNTAISRNLGRLMQVAEDALARGENLEAALLAWIEAARDRSFVRWTRMGQYGAELIADGDGVLTMCFAENSFILTLIFAREAGKSMRVFVPETRPYLQGARLTAPSLHELGFAVQLITDNMPAYVLSQGKVQKYFTAADLVTLDGHVVNKIGTFQNALAAHYHGVPYFALCSVVDASRPDRASIVIEERDPAEVRAARGTPTTLEDIPAYYPAFDITPPHLVSGIVTEYGVLNPYDLRRFYRPDAGRKGR